MQAQTPLVNAPDNPELSIEQRREHARASWAAVAGAWTEHADDTDHRHAAETSALLDATDVGPADRVRDGVRAALEPYATPTVYHLPGVAPLVTARRGEPRFGAKRRKTS